MAIQSLAYKHPDGKRVYCKTLNHATIAYSSPSLEAVKKCSDIWEEMRPKLRKWLKQRVEGGTCYPIFTRVSEGAFDYIIMDLENVRILRIGDSEGEDIGELDMPA